MFAAIESSFFLLLIATMNLPLIISNMRNRPFKMHRDLPQANSQSIRRENEWGGAVATE
jgi:hypothetical protein